MFETHEVSMEELEDGRLRKVHRTNSRPDFCSWFPEAHELFHNLSNVDRVEIRCKVENSLHPAGAPDVLFIYEAK